MNKVNIENVKVTKVETGEYGDKAGSEAADDNLKGIQVNIVNNSGANEKFIENTTNIRTDVNVHNRTIIGISNDEEINNFNCVSSDEDRGYEKEKIEDGNQIQIELSGKKRKRGWVILSKQSTKRYEENKLPNLLQSNKEKSNLEESNNDIESKGE